MNFKDIESNFQATEDGKCASGQNGIVTTAFPDATEAGVKILKAGGNAIDAACAAALALGVCEPQASGIGGQTMMLIHDGNKVIALDGSSRAPSLAHVRAIYKADRASGYRATTVPSTLATLGYVQQRYGQLSWSKVVEPAIKIATDGYKITQLQHNLQIRELTKFDSVESKSGKKYFFKNDYPYPVGEIFNQPDLALLRGDDLALIPWPIERRPLRGRFRNLTIYSMPLPGAGRTVLFALAMLNSISPKRLNNDKIRRAQLLAEIFRKALLERSDRPFDPNFYPQVEEKDMLNTKYAYQCIKKIVKAVAPDLPIRETVDELSGETTHLSVMDKHGMAVSLTQSIERVYGSKAAADGLGFLYNNYMMDFEYEMLSHPFYLRPNAVPWATVAPCLIFNKNKIWMALGSPGSERITSTIAQFLIHVVDEGMSIGEAMFEPRLHCSLGGRISVEAERFPHEIIESFEEKGYRINRKEPYAFYLGAIHAVMKCRDSDGFQGVAEVRRDGTAKGY